MELARTARGRTGLSQRGFAQLLGVHQPNVAHWERGKVKPSALTVALLRLLRAYGRDAARVLAAARAEEGLDVSLLGELLPAKPGEPEFPELDPMMPLDDALDRLRPMRVREILEQRLPALDSVSIEPLAPAISVFAAHSRPLNKSGIGDLVKSHFPRERVPYPQKHLRTLVEQEAKKISRAVRSAEQERRLVLAEVRGTFRTLDGWVLHASEAASTLQELLGALCLPEAATHSRCGVVAYVEPPSIHDAVLAMRRVAARYLVWTGNGTPPQPPPLQVDVRFAATLLDESRVDINE